jgi:hypothetical protein
MPEMHAVAYAGGKSALKMSPAMLAACHTILHGRSMKAADEFMESLVTGLELSRATRSMRPGNGLSASPMNGDRTGTPSIAAM